jgi:hypothetical protein
VRDALVDAVAPLPSRLRRSLTWDQGVEMSRHDEFTRASDVAVYFCERASPWQRGTNENTNGLLRQYFPKSTDLRVHTAAQLASVAAELNAQCSSARIPSRGATRFASPTTSVRAPAQSSLTARDRSYTGCSAGWTL